MYIGIDVGGTNIVAGVVDAAGTILTKAKCLTRSIDGATAIIDDCVKMAHEACQKANISENDIKSIGLGIPGAIDNDKGEVIFCPNIPFVNIPLRQIIQSKWDIPIHLVNDANAAAYGEAFAGSAKGCSEMVLITLGTGIGGGIVVNGKLYTGFNNIAGEIGHIVIVYDGLQCDCGRKGCWEKYASATGLINITKSFMEKHEDSKLWQIAPTPEEVDGRTAFTAAKQGDDAGKAAIDLFLGYLACGISSIINTFQPEIICIGGGICNEGDALLEPLKEIVKRNTFRHTEKNTELRIASLGNDAGLIGAALARK
jgi:glucokinase